ncbi:UNVERIFIED_CONTAM: hypothetical protein FKN15_076699 [Acipenser sinensis]
MPTARDQLLLPEPVLLLPEPELLLPEAEGEAPLSPEPEGEGQLSTEQGEEEPIVNRQGEKVKRPLHHSPDHQPLHRSSAGRSGSLAIAPGHPAVASGPLSLGLIPRSLNLQTQLLHLFPALPDTPDITTVPPVSYLASRGEPDVDAPRCNTFATDTWSLPPRSGPPSLCEGVGMWTPPTKSGIIV